MFHILKPRFCENHSDSPAPSHVSDDVRDSIGESLNILELHPSTEKKQRRKCVLFFLLIGSTIPWQKLNSKLCVVWRSPDVLLCSYQCSWKSNETYVRLGLLYRSTCLRNVSPIIFSRPFWSTKLMMTWRDKISIESLSTEMLKLTKFYTISQ